MLTDTHACRDRQSSGKSGPGKPSGSLGKIPISKHRDLTFWNVRRPNHLPHPKVWYEALMRRAGMGNGSHLWNFEISLLPFSSSFLSLSLCLSPPEVSGYLCNESNPLDIIDLCPQLPSNAQLFNTAPALSHPEVIQRWRDKGLTLQSCLFVAQIKCFCATCLFWLIPHYNAISRALVWRASVS